MHRLVMIVALLQLLGLPSSVVPESGETREGRIAVTVVDVDGQALPAAGVSLCPVESDQVHALDTEDNECRFQASGTDGSATFDKVAPGRYRLTASLTGFADTSVFPLSIAAPRSGPRAPESVTLLLNAVCYHC